MNPMDFTTKGPAMPEVERIRMEHPAPGVVLITLARPEKRNAQDTRMLYELNEAFDRFAQDDNAKVAVLAGDGPDFSSGHDFSEEKHHVMHDHRTVGTWCGFTCGGAESQMAREKEAYLGFSERWRNIPKPTIAAVQGRVISGGLMLCWPCDLIVAAEGTVFVDNTVAMGVSGAEFFQHHLEVGVRKAKEMLFTSDSISAEVALRHGMVNHVVPREQLLDFSLDLAGRIAEQPLFALKLVKEAVNAGQDAAGRTVGLNHAFANHQISHAHNQILHGRLLDPSFHQRSGAIAERW